MDEFLLTDDVPVALFPVRIETRFIGAELLIRIYPDDLHVDSHEPELTESEWIAGVRFWTELWRSGPARRTRRGSKRRPT